MKKICFVELYSYSLFNQETKYLFGGAEVRAYTLGTALAKKPEFDVSFVVFNHGQPSKEIYNSVNVFAHSYYSKIVEANDLSNLTGLMGRIKGIAFSALLKILSVFPSYFFNFSVNTYKKMIARYEYFISKLSKQKPGFFIQDYWIVSDKWETYRAIDADIYCIFGVSNLSAELAAFCEQEHKKFVLFTACDADLSATYTESSKKLNTYGASEFLCAYSLQRADLIITQTRQQSTLVENRFHKKSMTIPNPIDLTKNENLNQNRNIALWIGKSDFIKRPELLLKLAGNFPEIQFCMVLNPSIPTIHTKIIANKPDNVRIIEYVPYDTVEKLFSRAFVLINTSVFEGFPNTFLQAGKHSVPVLSFNVDPDGFIEKYSCGFVAHGNFNEMVNDLEILLRERPNLYSKNINKYVREHHDLEIITRSLSKIFTEITN